MRLLITVLVATAALHTGSAQAMTQHNHTVCGEKKLLVDYSAQYYAVKHKMGKRAPGRNIRKLGVRIRVHHGAHAVRPSRCHEIAVSLRQLRTLRARVPWPGPPLLTRTVGGKLAPAGVMQSGVAAHLPACADESHGNYSTGPANTNPGSGATGRWQTLRSHYSPGGVCQGLNVNVPGDQDTCAARIYEEQGAGAWVGC